MNRRAFLRTLTSGLAATAALATLDPDELLWTPGHKTFFLPPAGGWKPGLMFHKDAFALVTKGLFNPSADIARQYREGTFRGVEYRAEWLEENHTFDALRYQRMLNELQAKMAEQIAEQIDDYRVTIEVGPTWSTRRARQAEAMAGLLD